ncbi:MAG: hypothetical protein FH748_03535 [Balneolaceae bacterium]|nr:hypothetical protein [Balneolaceae bacterium]
MAANKYSLTIYRIFFPLALLLLLTGCHSYVLDDAQYDLRNSFAAGNFEKSEHLLNRFEEKNIYRSKDAVLKNLEGGMIHHFAGSYDTSNTYFHSAEQKIDEAYTKSISRGLAALLANDNTLVYDGEPYEDVYLNAFKSLNYVHLHNWEAALVETRRMAYKMEQLDIRIKGIAEAFAKKDTAEAREWKSGEVNLQNSAFSHYLSAILYAKSGHVDDARIEYEKLGTALEEQKRLRRYPVPRHSGLKEILYPNRYNVLLSGFTGQSPVKEQEDIRIWLNGYDGDEDESFYVKFSLPKLTLVETRVQNVRAVINDEKVVPLKLIEEMDVVSAEVYSAKQPIIYTRAMLRATAKATGSHLIANAVRKENKGLGALFDILGIIGQETTEKADLRSWQTLPGQAWMNVVDLPLGTHEIRMEYVAANGDVLYTDIFDVIIAEDIHLELVESIYSY